MKEERRGRKWNSKRKKTMTSIALYDLARVACQRLEVCEDRKKKNIYIYIYIYI